MVITPHPAWAMAQAVPLPQGAVHAQRCSHRSQSTSTPKPGAALMRGDRAFDLDGVAGYANFVVVGAQHVAGILFHLHVRRRDYQVGHGGGGDVELEVGADRTGYAVRRGEVDDFFRFANAALLAGVDADHVAALVAHQLLGMCQVEANIVGHYRHARFAAHAGQRRVVAVGRGLLDQGQVAVGQFVHAADGRVDVPAAVGIDGERDVGADRGAHGPHALDVLAASVPTLTLMVVKPAATSSRARACARSGS